MLRLAKIRRKEFLRATVRRLPFARKVGGEPKARKPRLACADIYKDIGWFQVFMNKTTLMETSECDCQANRNPHKQGQVPRLTELARKDLAAVILNQQCWISVVTI